MARWSLRNRFRSISHEQFCDITRNFKDAAEKSFGTECELNIELLSAPLAYTTFFDEDLMDMMAEINKANTSAKTASLDDILPKQFNKAVTACVRVNPIDKDAAPASAFGTIKFKGNLRRTATFYLQQGRDDDTAQDEVLAKYPRMLQGDGYEETGNRAPFLPASISRLGF